MYSIKVTGWGYNAEAFDAVTGMINLRARQYEPAINRFGQKDTKAKIKVAVFSDNEYQYAKNNVHSLG